MSREIALFKRRLTNLSSANPLLWISRLKSDIHLDLFDWESQGASAWEVVSAALSSQHQIRLCKRVDARDETQAQLSFKIQKLLRQQRLGIEERGVDELYLAYPFVCGYWPDGQPIRTPLLYFPVRLKATQADWLLQPIDQGAFVNPAFLLAYAHHFQTPLAEPLYDKDLPIEEPDGVSFLTQLYHLLKDQNLAIHFNQELFAQRITPFKPMGKQDEFEGLRAGQLKLFPHALLGLFPQSNSLLIPDFNFLEEQEITLEDIFSPKPEGNTTATSMRNQLLPFRVDGSQESCINQIKKGKNLVVQGPPGSGKSQLISNLVADAMGAGQTVLVVCQKRVALEVVQQRLESLGLENSVCLWADPKKDKPLLYEKLARIIENLDDTEQKFLQLETVVLERHHNLLSRQIDEINQKLENWKNTLFQLEPAGKNILQLYEMAEKTGVDLPAAPFLLFNWEEWQHFQTWYRKYGSDFHFSLGKDSPFRHRTNWKEHKDRLPDIWLNLLRDVRELDGRYLSLVDQITAPSQSIASLFAQKDCIEAFDFYEWSQKTELRRWIGSFKADFLQEEGWSKRKQQLYRLKRAISNLSHWPVNLAISPEQLPKAIQTLQSQLWKFSFKPLFWLNSKLYPEWSFLHHLYRHFPQAKAADLLQFLQHAEEWHKACQPFFSGNQGILTHGFIIELRQFEQALNLLLEEGDRARQVVLDYQRRFPGKWDTIDDFFRHFEQLKATLMACEHTVRQWNSYFKTDQSAELFQYMHTPEAWINSYGLYKKSIEITDVQCLEIPNHWQALIMGLIDSEIARMEKDRQLHELTKNWVWAWIHKLETDNPILSEAGTQVWEIDLDILRKAVAEKQRLSLKILHQALNEKQCKNLEYNRLGNRTSYRDLQYQVRKKRNRPSFRKLWTEHSTEICKLIPAWLCTPESVSSSWPMAQVFDLVIFDEASQCFAERGLPAAYRGRQVVIVGDENQLPPNSLFSTRWDSDSEEEDNPFTSQDSFLNLARQFLPQVMLQGHYRSQYPELIAFSNKAFYQNKLEFIPHSSALLPRTPALEWTFVGGQWDMQQNLEEAEAIAKALPAFFATHPNDTLGIIAFSARQQNCIENAIAKAAAGGRFEIPDWLFVKNIENVQGDERDHIWFSIAYGKNQQDRMNAQYGLLGQEGGENRLNVAITRARKAIRIFASIYPDDFALSDTAGKGPKLLKDYLRYVYQIAHEKLKIDPVIASGLALEYDQMHGTPPCLTYSDWSGLPYSASILDFFVYKYAAAQEKGYKMQYIYTKPSYKK